MSDACEFSMRRITSYPNKKVAHWNETIAQARRLCTERRRVFTRYRRVEHGVVLRAQRLYKQAKRDLRREIRRAKAAAWAELIESIDGDPWGHLAGAGSSEGIRIGHCGVIGPSVVG